MGNYIYQAEINWTERYTDTVEIEAASTGEAKQRIEETLADVLQEISERGSQVFVGQSVDSINVQPKE